MKKILTVLIFICCLFQLSVAQAGMIGKQEEIKMGSEVASQLEAQYGVVHDDDLQERVERIGQSLVKQCDRKDLHYTFKVLNTNDVNALSVPGGFVYVFKGLIDFMPSDDELAGVLGHEIGHIVKRHSVHQIEKQLALSLLTIVAGVASGDPGAGIMLASTACQVLMAGYSRADEREADEQGFMLTNKAGYNPYSIYVTMCKLNDLAKEQGNPGYGIFSSHPEPEVRMAKAMKALEAMHITPLVTIDKDGSAKVTEGKWQYEFSNTVGSDKPEYRARLMAGALYLAKKRGIVDETRFITIDNDGYTDVYYDDIRVVRVYNADNMEFPTLSDYAGEVAAKLQLWAREVNEKQ
ncbi:MAG: M48 family metallopeptidase [Acidaminococcaceae bacterium]|nr:M48 family metallopeptidase [Acidaminococcaceae bacterium]